MSTTDSRRKRGASRSQRASGRDPVTGLPDRDGLERHLADIDGSVALLVVDVDHFATVQVTMGQDAGADVLRQLAQRLGSTAPAGSYLARTGGNSFSLVVDGADADRDAACALADLLLAVVRQPVSVEGRTLRVSASVGVALPLGGEPGGVLLVDDLHRRADLALLEAKGGARGRFAVWEPQLSLRSAQRLEAQQDLRAALQQADGLTLHYQPIVAVATREATAVECLVRRAGKDPAVGAERLLAAAADLGLLAALDRRVLDLAQADLELIAESSSALRVHVNVSADGLADPGWVDTLGAAAAGGPRLCVEVTEHALVSTGTSGARHLEELRAAGHLVALDDFGAGYTSLATLASLPADVLKLDRSLLFDVDVDPRRRAVLAGALTLGRDLGLTVVAEGVETEDQHAVLVDLGCDEAQGWLHGRPRPLNAAELRA